MNLNIIIEAVLREFQCKIAGLSERHVFLALSRKAVE